MAWDWEVVVSAEVAGIRQEMTAKVFSADAAGLVAAQRDAGPDSASEVTAVD